MKKSARIYITGSVQGMFFRQFIKDKADENKVKGFTRNLEDGRVEAFFEGEQENVDATIALCKRGPPHSIIRNVDQKEEKFQDFKEFKILKF